MLLLGYCIRGGTPSDQQSNHQTTKLTFAKYKYYALTGTKDHMIPLILKNSQHHPRIIINGNSRWVQT